MTERQQQEGGAQFAVDRAKAWIALIVAIVVGFAGIVVEGYIGIAVIVLIAIPAVFVAKYYNVRSKKHE